jgi:hypothetical protein
MSFKKEASLALKKYGSLIKNDKDLINATNISNILLAAFGKCDDEVFKTAYSLIGSLNPKSENDYYYLVLRALIKNDSMKKNAYPLMSGSLYESVEGEYDIEKWADLVYQIFDSVDKDEMTLEHAIEHFSKGLDKSTDEDLKFKKWVKYYKSGEHLKYSKKKEEQMKKRAVYQFPLNGGGTYPPELGSRIMEEKNKRIHS